MLTRACKMKREIYQRGQATRRKNVLSQNEVVLKQADQRLVESEIIMAFGSALAPMEHSEIWHASYRARSDATRISAYDEKCEGEVSQAETQKNSIERRARVLGVWRG